MSSCIAAQSGGDASTSSNYITQEGNSEMTTDADLDIPGRERTIMAICTASTRCGCAIYQDSTVYLVADRRDLGDPYKGLDIIIQRVIPEIVIVSMAQRQLITFIEKRFKFKVVDYCRGYNTTDDCLEPAFTLAIVPNSWFSISHGESKLIDSEWINVKGLKDPEQRSLTVFSKVKKSVDVCAIRAISGIDRYLAQEFSLDFTSGNQMIDTVLGSQLGRQIQNLESQVSQITRTTTDEAKIPENFMPILDVRYMDPGPVLSIDKFTLQSLGIFPEKRNKLPTNSSDPDLVAAPSLYDILNQCHSIQGKKTLHTIMMWPLQELEEIHHRHLTVDFFLRPENRIFRDQLIMQLKNVVPLSGILTKLIQSIGDYKILSVLYKSLWAFIAIIDLIKSSSCSEIEILNRIMTLDCPGFRSAVDSIVSVIDFEASKRERRIQVCLGVDENVDEKREVIKNLARFCDEVATQETAKYKDVIGKPFRILYLPRIGFLSSVDYTSTADLTNMSSNKEFDIMLTTEQSVYFKTKRMEDLDRNAGDITCDLIDVQEKVIVKLQNDILEHSERILRMMELCGELDCLISFSLVSHQRAYVRPEFVTSSDGIDIRDAHHPLQSVRQSIVPNNIRFFKEDTEKKARVLVITGPNSCGKTTYMKTACLTIYMAHIGCFVPAVDAKIPIVDAILTRMHSINSISTGLSSFATDLNQINYALARATSRSFIAIDEFGKGTQAKDGFHLLKGLVAYFAVRGPASPHVMIATHYNRLIDHLQGYYDYIIYKTFKVSRDISKATINYEFKIQDGVSESSLADEVAINAGIPRHIIDRANQIRDHITGGRPIQPRPPLGA